MRPSGGIDATAIWKTPANHDVVDADKQGQGADRANDRQGGKSRRRKGEPQNIGLAGAPVAVKKSGGPLPVDCAGAE
jgi:hypothetical protein